MRFNCQVSRYEFECRSLMFIYDTNECLLNAHHRYSRPDLLSNDTKGFIVDYFDNYCAGVECSDGAKPYYVKVQNFSSNSLHCVRFQVNEGDIREGSAVEVADADVHTCRSFCTVFFCIKIIISRLFSEQHNHL